jgi:hypothetical protein
VLAAVASLFAAGPVHAAGATTSLSFVGAAGDYVGAGGSATFTAPSDTIKISGTLGSLTVSVTSGSEFWTLVLAAPDTAQLRPGVYANAERAPFRDPGHPGIDFFGDGRGCNQDFGTFTIGAISSDHLGNVTLLDATFTQHCESADAPALTGTVKYAALPSAAVELSSAWPDSVLGEPVSLSARVATPAGGSVSFADGAVVLGQAPVDANGFAHFSTNALAVGVHTITASYQGSHSAALTQTVRDDTNAFWFISPSGDFIGHGATESYASPADTVTLAGTASSLTVHSQDSGAVHWWYATIAAPPGETLHTGTYTDVERAAFRTAGHAGLDVFGEGRGCNTVAGQLTVSTIQVDDAGKVTAFDATFSQNCESTDVPPLVGAVHFGTRVAADQTILGALLQVKDPKPGVAPTKRTIVGKGQESHSPNTVVGVPTTGGAALTVIATGTTSSTDTYPMPATFWSAVKGGFKYKDTKLVAGPVKAAQLKLVKGKFQLQVVVAGTKGGIGVVPPSTGTGGCLLLEIAGGDRYHVLFPSPPDSTIKKNDAKTFQVRNASVEGTCPQP